MCAKCKTPFLCGQGNFANFLFLACPMFISGSNRFVDQRRVKIHILAEAENQTQTPPVGYYVILPFSVCLSKVSKRQFVNYKFLKFSSFLPFW